MATDATKKVSLSKQFSALSGAPALGSRKRVQTDRFTVVHTSPAKESSPNKLKRQLSDIPTSEEEIVDSGESDSEEEHRKKRNPKVVFAQTLRSRSRKNYAEPEESDDDEEVIRDEESDEELVPKRKRNRVVVSEDEGESSSNSDSEEQASESEDEEEGESTLIEDILAVCHPSHTKNVPSSVKEKQYFIKARGESYIHAKWFTIAELEERFTNAKQKLSKYNQQFQDEEEEEYLPDFKNLSTVFNPDFLLIDRIVDERNNNGEEERMLVKWKALTYEECTWEDKKVLLSTVENAEERIQYYYAINSEEALNRTQRFPQRPAAAELNEEELQIPKFKDDHQLKEYQKEGFKWLVHCWYHRRNSILADEMGLGKTIQATSILHYLHQEHGLCGPFLIVAPMVTLEQWKKELEGWTNMNVVVYHGSADARELIYEKEWFFKDQRRSSKIYKFDVLITTFELVLKETSKLSAVPWQYLVVDEAHRIKNKNSKLFQALKKLKTAHKLILTGTPIQNGVQELWALMNFLQPKLFRDCDAFMKEFGDLKQARQVELLHKKLGPYMLRRTKEQVEKSIPRKEETIVEIELSNIQKLYYRAIFERKRELLTKNSTKASLMNIMMQLRKCCNHPYLIKGVEDKIIGDLIENSEDPRPKMTEALFERFVNSSSKFIFMDKLLARLRESKHRVLIFSQMTKLLDLLEQYMEYKKYPCERLDGSIKRVDRLAAIDRFSNPDIDCFVFLLGTRAGGLGINLTIADTVILFDSDWNPQNDLQAQARCHRIGQVNTVKVYRLITRRTYEKRMFDIASKKLGLDKVVLGKRLQEEGEDDTLNNFKKEEIEHLLKYGAYALLDDDDQKQQDFDLDSILESSTTYSYQSCLSEKDNQLSGFSKATYRAQSDEEAVDLNDEHFWEKVLPTYKSLHALDAQLKDPFALQSKEQQEKFMAHTEQLVTDMQQRAKHVSVFSSFDPSNELLQLLKKIKYNMRDVFPSSYIDQLNLWINTLEHPRLRSKRTTNASSASDETETNRDDKNKESKVVKVKKQQKKQKHIEWPKAQRDRVKTALLTYGYGRWEEIHKASELDSSKNIQHTQSLAQSIISIASCKPEAADKEKDSDDTKDTDAADNDQTESLLSIIVDSAAAEVKALLKKALTDKNSATHSSESVPSIDILIDNDEEESEYEYVSGDSLALKINCAQELKDVYLLVRYLGENGEYNAAVMCMKVEGNSLTIQCPGFRGFYTLQCITFSKDKKEIIECGSLQHAVHSAAPKHLVDKYKGVIAVRVPDVLTTSDYQSENAHKLWRNRLMVLSRYEYVRNRVNVESVEIPSLQLAAPAVYWNSHDDRKLLIAIHKHGYLKFDEIRKDPTFEWDEASLRERIAKCGADTASTEKEKSVFPNSAVLNKRFNRLVDVLYKSIAAPSAASRTQQSDKPSNKKRSSTDGESSSNSNKKLKASSDSTVDKKKKKKTKDSSDDKENLKASSNSVDEKTKATVEKKKTKANSGDTKENKKTQASSDAKKQSKKKSEQQAEDSASSLKKRKVK